jgi:hypothetical protein
MKFDTGSFTKICGGTPNLVEIGRQYLALDEVTGEWRRLHNEELNDLY